VVAGNAQVAWLSRILCGIVAHVVGFSRIVRGAREGTLAGARCRIPSDPGRPVDRPTDITAGQGS